MAKTQNPRRLVPLQFGVDRVAAWLAGVDTDEQSAVEVAAEDTAGRNVVLLVDMVPGNIAAKGGGQ